MSSWGWGEYDWVCAICDNGGDILSCRGSCLRSFHATPDPTLYCETLNFTPAQVQEMNSFLCDNCLYKKHQCYACGILGSSAISDQEVFICGSSDCGLHYHPHCVSKLLYPRDETKAGKLVVKIKEGRGFECPRHLCHICRGLENKKNYDLQFAICRRCPISYHRRCLPSDILFEDKGGDNLQRAWEDLLPYRILIYCMKHKIEKDLGTPMRNHLQFPPVNCKWRPKKEVFNSNHQPPVKNQHRIAQTGGPRVLSYGEKQRALESASAAEARLPRSCFPPISEKTQNNMRALLENESSSVTIEKVRTNLKIPSMYHNSQRQTIESISEREVKETVERAIAAWAKLRNHGTVEEAKAICSPDTLSKICDWRTKLSVYLAPFIHGSRYTSFGRHFTKVDKLMEVVDFCCGSNDFSILMRDKLSSVGKKCFFKNFDLHQPKNDFNFEKRDWMTVEPHELPDGDRLIMGLNPPFGVKAALANRFIDQALKFNPKILILIVPKETKRLDKKHEYDLIWHDPCLLSGKSFYLPGSVDDKQNQMEQWNLKPPPLYLWSRRDWAPLHTEIANKNGHLSPSGEKNFLANQLLYYNNSSSSEEEEGEIKSDLLVEQTKEHDDDDDDDRFLSDMSISSPEPPEPDVKMDDDEAVYFSAGLEPGPSTAQFDYWAVPPPPGLGGWLSTEFFDDN
ncbi:EDM2-like protein1 isoform X2 [Carex rostrata]